MQEFIITTPDQLKTVIAETVEDILQRQLKSLPIAETHKEQDCDLLTRKDAAKLLSISLPTLNEWSKNGQIKGYRIGTRVRYKRSEIIESLNAMRTSKKWRAA
jgi:excisionase family DNA binding protein